MLAGPQAQVAAAQPWQAAAQHSTAAGHWRQVLLSCAPGTRHYPTSTKSREANIELVTITMLTSAARLLPLCKAHGILSA